MDTLDLTALDTCLATLRAGHARLLAAAPDSIEHQLFRAACVKEFELLLELVVKMLRKALREYVTSTRELGDLPFKDVLRQAARFGLLRIDAVDQWFAYRDLRNTTAHEYGHNFAQKIIDVLPAFISDCQVVIARLRQSS